MIVDALRGLLNGIKDAVTSLPSQLKGFFDSIKDAILGLPTLILDGIKAIFIPDAEYIETSFNGFLSELKMKFGVDFGFFESLFQGESAVDDVKGNYTIPGVGAFNLTFLDTSFFIQGVTYFRPFIRGFLVFLMMLYHIRQLIGFFGYNAGVIGGRGDSIETNLKMQRVKD